MGLILAIIVFMILLAALPAWPYSRTWGYAPGSLLGAILLIVILLMLFGALPFWFAPTPGPGPVIVHP
jgi:hypothetical protein